MADGYIALRVPAHEDLGGFVALLRQQRVPHRVYEAAGEQVLEVASAEHARAVSKLFEAWRDNALPDELRSPPARQASPSGPPLLLSAPVTLALIVLGIAGFLLVYLGAPVSWLSLFTFAPFEFAGGSIRFGDMGSQYWRLITPAFLHFGWLHIVFNSLWLWELGSRVERTLGAAHMLGLFLVIAIVSNGSQYLFGGPSIFGGMSGVVYGLLGFSFVGARLQPAWRFEPSAPIMLLMVGWLLLCLAGVIEVLGFGAIANAAHVGGLLTGGVLGAVMALLSVGLQRDRG
ncbi:rhomboid family intramembrane serine protease [Kineobactrum sediminis]|uniref:Rhomboid family intramembrane serine protease n=1 Tax=Kineobactrum sediminis TaxID=1905677 RepID=A0A2N5Y2K5_9GAMM|nr:rhomboid family intramembrane serine protease [Kineobactrum sediminis]PLW82630.1 rhomboid family intramembrane serine protease [Kineobactrum sediminis]